MPTHKQALLRKLNLPEGSYSLAELSRATGVPVAGLQEVYNRGVGAWKSNIGSVRLLGSFAKNPDVRRFPRSARLPKEQWAMARVYSFLNRGKTYKTADADIAKRYHY